MDDGTAIITDSGWHPGEIEMQRHAGVVERMALRARQVIRDHLIEQHRTFFPLLPFVVAGTVDPNGDAWATVLAGRPGFLKAPDASRLRVTTSPGLSDPANSGLNDGDAIGLLGIELHTRRRNRLNGTIRRIDAQTFDVAVAQSYGNCPQYIRLRQFAFVRDPTVTDETAPILLDRLDARSSAMISVAETFFIASYVDREDGRRQVDVSHRGGKPGFVAIGEDGVLIIPDFAGNRYFNTLGNILLNPRCGLVFVDFETGDMLQVTGNGKVVLDAPEIAAFQGAERLLRFTPRRIVYRPDALPLRWRSPPDGASPNALLTGSWTEAAARTRAAELGGSWRGFRITKIVEESTVIRSLYLQPADSAGVPPHLPGQYLPVRVRLHGAEVPARRSYSLSSAASDGLYRISVKREGAVSGFLHTLGVGDTIEAREPAGAFTLDTSSPRPAVLLAAGVGVTPMIAMLRHILYEGKRTRTLRPTWFLYGARSKPERAFDAEIAALAAASGGRIVVTRALSDTSGADRADFEIAGRIGMDVLRQVSPLEECEFFICGPREFTQELYDGLRDEGVSDARIFAEAFGPGSLRRRRAPGDPAIELPAAARGEVDMIFSASGKRGRWSPGSGSLLEFAEAQGIDPPSSCRAGSCGTCRTRIVAGAVTYAVPPDAEVAKEDALICCALPTAEMENGGELILDL